MTSSNAVRTEDPKEVVQIQHDFLLRQVEQLSNLIIDPVLIALDHAA